MIIITEQHLKTISEAIKNYSGIVMERVTQRLAEKKIITQMEILGVQNPSTYVEFIKQYEANTKIIDALIDSITISESYLFRNPRQFEYLLTEYFPQFFENNKYRYPLRIWSAGCSHGEEPYSIAMIAKDFQQTHSKARFTINAGDINQLSLSKAKKGVYTAKSLHDKLEIFEQKLGYPIGEYDEKGNCLISQNIKNMVEFQKLNLKNISKLKIMTGSDIIFCRNVLIYFDEALRSKLIETFFDCLNPGGLLFLGESECFSYAAKVFELRNIQGSYAYRKPK